MLVEESDDTTARWCEAMRNYGARWDTTLASWREALTENERQLVSFATLYTGHFRETVAGNGRLELIAKLAALLDGRPVEV